MRPAAQRRRQWLRAAAAGCWTAVAGSAAAQSAAYPGRPLRWVVAYPAGGGSDFLARTLAPALARQLGQPVVIENRPGAAGVIGTDSVAKAPADGHTLLTGDNGAMVFHGAMLKRLPYDPAELAPVALMARFPLIVAVAPQSGFTSLPQLLDAVKRAPGRYSYASPGVGSPHHLAMELLKERSGSFVVHVPFRGMAPAVQEVLANQVPMLVVDTAAGLPQFRAGRLRPLAVLSQRRLVTLPEVPTADELGLRGLEVSAWQGLFVPRGTAADIVGRLSSEVQRALALPEVRGRLEEFGLEPTPSDAPRLAAFVERETAFWHKLIRDRRLTAD